VLASLRDADSIDEMREGLHYMAACGVISDGGQEEYKLEGMVVGFERYVAVTIKICPNEHVQRLAREMFFSILYDST
jgi:hypothetical protein